MNEHRWRNYGDGEVACQDCGQEPWHRPAPCPGPHRPQTPVRAPYDGEQVDPFPTH